MAKENTDILQQDQESVLKGYNEIIKNNISPGGIGHYEEWLWKDVIRTLEYFPLQAKEVKHPIFISGDSGSGKTYVAKNVIHKLLHPEDASLYKFITVRCAMAQDKRLFRSELFGYAPGTFTDGLPKGKAGWVELAEKGTLFFDEIADLPLETQASLLDFFDDRKYSRAGSDKTVCSNTTLIFASNRNIEKLVDNGRFLPDLFKRICRLRIAIPPLRMRWQSIGNILNYLFAKLINTQGSIIKSLLLTEIIRELTKRAILISSIHFENQLIVTLDIWDGNLRDLENVALEFDKYRSADIKMAYKKVKEYFINKIAASRDSLYKIYSISRVSNGNIRQLLPLEKKETTESILKSQLRDVQQGILFEFNAEINEVFSPDYRWWFNNKLEDVKDNYSRKNVKHWKRYHSEDISKTDIRNIMHVHPNEITKCEQLISNEINDEAAVKKTAWWCRDFAEEEAMYLQSRTGINSQVKRKYKDKEVQSLQENSQNNNSVETNDIYEEHPTGWWDDDWQKVEKRYYLLLEEYYELFQPGATIEEKALKAGVTRQTYSNKVGIYKK